MPTNVKPGDRMPDFELPDHTGASVELSCLTAPSLLEQRLGFNDGSALVLVFYRGFFCTRDHMQMRALVDFQDELEVGFGKLVTVSVDPPRVSAAYRAGLGARWPFLSDEERRVIRELDIVDETEGEYANVAQPHTFVLFPDLVVHSVYNGWFFAGRPTIEELRRDLRAVTSQRTDYAYEAYTNPAVQAVRIPQQDWAEGMPPLGASGRTVAHGVVHSFDLDQGLGTIVRNGSGEEVFFHFTAIPGEGYRTVEAGTKVAFELVHTSLGVSAWNIRVLE